MSWNLEEVDDYIRKNTIDNEDWFRNEDERKEAILNVAKRTLKNKLGDDEELPDEAVYLTARAFATAYNDTMIQWQRGIASFSVKGMSFTFKDWASQGLDEWIPDEVFEMLDISKRGTKWTVI